MGKRSPTKKPARGRGRGRKTPTLSPSPLVSDVLGDRDGRDSSSPPRRDASPAGSTASSAASTSTLQPHDMKKRAKKTQFCLDPEEEQIMCDFVRENDILWNVKKTDYRRVDKKTKLWEDQAKIMGKTVDHLQGWFRSLRDAHTRLQKKKSGDGTPDFTERIQRVRNDQRTNDNDRLTCL